MDLKHGYENFWISGTIEGQKIERKFEILEEKNPEYQIAESPAAWELRVLSRARELFHPLYQLACYSTGSVGEADMAELEGAIEGIRKRTDCSDFLLAVLQRLMKCCQIPETIRQKAKNTMLDYCYWMDETGSDALYIRHADGVSVTGCDMFVSPSDARPAIDHSEDVTNYTTNSNSEGGITFANPILDNATDPSVTYYGGNYYAVHTGPGGTDYISVRKAPRLAELQETKEVRVYEDAQGEKICAPEIHRIDDKWYIYYCQETDHNRQIYVLEADTDDAQGTYTGKGEISLPTEDNIDPSVFIEEETEELFFCGIALENWEIVGRKHS